MNILIYVNTWPPNSSPNGIVTYASIIIPALREIGHNVYIFTPNKTKNDPHTFELSKLSRIHKFAAFLLGFFSPEHAHYFIHTTRICATLRNVFQAKSIDIIEMEESFGWCAAVSKLGLAPVVTRLHGPWFLTGPAGNRRMDTTGNKRRMENEGNGIAKAAGISAPSSFVLEKCINFYQQHSLIASVIPNPIHTCSVKFRWSASKANWNRLLFVGRFDNIKGADIAIQTFNILARDLPNIELDFIGPDIGLRQKDESSLNFNQYIEKFVDSDTRGRIHYHGALSRKEIDQFRINSCVIIVSSRVEMFPYVVLEALSLGCPLVATAVGGVPEMIIDGETGLLAKQCEPESIAHACRLFLRDKQLAARVGKAAAIHAEQNYGSLSVARRTVENYQRVINSNARGTR